MGLLQPPGTQADAAASLLGAARSSSDTSRRTRIRKIYSTRTITVSSLLLLMPMTIHKPLSTVLLPVNLHVQHLPAITHSILPPALPPLPTTQNNAGLHRTILGSRSPARSVPEDWLLPFRSTAEDQPAAAPVRQGSEGYVR